jgi:sterol 3beta-glucosyltransferase
MAAVVHHAGAGTAGAGLRAGMPAVAVPVMADQPFWAERLYRLGTAPRPIPFASLTAESLAGAITAATTGPGYRHRAAEAASRIAAEDGAGAVVAAVRPRRQRAGRRGRQPRRAGTAVNGTFMDTVKTENRRKRSYRGAWP